MSARKLILMLGLALAACGGAGGGKELPHPGLPPPPAVDHHEAACGAKTLWVQEPTPVATNLGTPQGKITALEVTGVTGDARVKNAIPFAVGDTFDAPKAQDAIRKIYALGDFDDVAIEVLEKDGGLAVRYRIVPRPELGEVFIEGDGEQDKKDELAKAFRAASGKSYNPRAITTARLGFLGAITKRGYMDATMDLKSAHNDDGSVDLCAFVKKGTLVTIEKVRFDGLKTIKETDIVAKIDTDGGKYNVAGGVVDGERVERAAQEIAHFLADRGMPTSEIAYDLQRKDDKATLIFKINEGPIFHVRRYEIVGDKIADAGTYQKLLKIKPKDLFTQSGILADKAAIDEFHKSKGRSDIELVPETALDPKALTVDVVFRVVDPKKPAKK
ncbi:hypothetical protein BH09MYX1_BH09MYX1_26040 [soil metagenome]